MDNEHIITTVESLLGKNVEIIDCETKSSIRKEEILLINGVPVHLDEEEGKAIKNTLVTGQVPSCDLLNNILLRAGILQQSVKLETTLSIKSTVLKTEAIQLSESDGGKLLNEKSCETRENNYYTSLCSETWEPSDLISTDSNNYVPPMNIEKLHLRKFNQNYDGKSLYRQNSTSSTLSTSASRSSSFESPTTGVCSGSSNSPTISQNNHHKTNQLPNSKHCPSNCNADGIGEIYSSDHDIVTEYDSMINNTTPSCSVFSFSSSVCCDDLSSTNDAVDFTHSVYKSNPSIEHLSNSMTNIFETGTPSNLYNKHKGSKKISEQCDSTLCFPAQIEPTKAVNQDVMKHLEAELNENVLIYNDGRLVSGSLPALIQHMVPTNDYYPDRSYVFAFLLSSRLFIKPVELIEVICKQYDETHQLNIVTNNTMTNLKLKSKFVHNFVHLVTEWTETFPYDFRDERMIKLVKCLVEKYIQVDDTIANEFEKSIISLKQRLKLLENYEKFLNNINEQLTSENLPSTNCEQQNQTQSCVGSSISCGPSENTNIFLSFFNTNSQLVTNKATPDRENVSALSQQSPYMPNSSNQSSLLTSYVHLPSFAIELGDLQTSPSFLAHQLTHIELERLFHIGPEEFVQAFAKENSQLRTTYKEVKKTRNLESYVQWFNRLSYLVASEIVKHQKKKQRVRLIEFWIETGRECFNIGNFNSLMAIISALNMSPILRLKKTWAKVQLAKFSILEHQMDPSSNFNSYRATLKAAMWRSAGATDEQQRIVIPFFSLFVKDLYFLNEGCSNKLPNGHINFDKFWQLAKQITKFVSWKQVSCPFEKNNQMIMLLQTSAILNDDNLAIASFECEPPENSVEKERFKSLKMEILHI